MAGSQSPEHHMLDVQKAASMGDFAAFVALHQNYTSHPTSMSDGKGHAFNLPIAEMA